MTIGDMVVWHIYNIQVIDIMPSDHVITTIRSKPICVVVSRKDTETFIADCHDIYQASAHRDVFCGIDFEFNTNHSTKKRYIGLMQIILVSDPHKYFEDHNKPIYIVDPSRLSVASRDQMIRYIFCSKVKKIFHGSDSLDYGYVYEDLLGSSGEQFIRFVDNSIDTRFMCEISKRISQRLGLTDIANVKEASGRPEVNR